VEGNCSGWGQASVADTGEANSELRRRIERRLEQLHESVPEGLTQAAPTLLPRLQKCLAVGNLEEAERMLDYALALINSSKNCVSCHN